MPQVLYRHNVELVEIEVLPEGKKVIAGERNFQGRVRKKTGERPRGRVVSVTPGKKAWMRIPAHWEPEQYEGPSERKDHKQEEDKKPGGRLKTFLELRSIVASKTSDVCILSCKTGGSTNSVIGSIK